MKASDVYGGQLMTSADFKEKATLVLVITKVVKSEFPGQRAKIKLTFDEHEKCLALNVENNKRMVAKLGDETDDWIGARIKLGLHKVKLEGELVDGIIVLGAKPYVPSDDDLNKVNSKVDSIPFDDDF